MKTSKRRLDVNLEELDRVLDGAKQAPLSDDDHDKLKGALHALVAMLARSPNNEKTSAVLGKPEAPPTSDANTPKKPGHGRNGAEAFDCTAPDCLDTTLFKLQSPEGAPGELGLGSGSPVFQPATAGCTW